MIDRLARSGTKFLPIPQIRMRFCKPRWKMMRKNLKFYEQPSAGVGEEVVSYNMTAFDSDAAFGCGGRMDLVLYPLAALMANKPADKPTFEHVRGNLINDVAVYKTALNLPAVFVNDPPTKTNHHKSLVFRKE